MKTKFCVIDIETKGLSARPESFVFGCVYADNFRKVFFDRKDFVNWLLSNQNPYKYIFAHNAEFDFTVLFDNIILNLDSACLFVGSTFVQAKKRGKVFCNSLPILKSSVKELGKNIGILKGETPKEYTEWKPGNKEIKVTPAHIEYCYKDCEIVFEFLKKVFSHTGRIKFTIASCAMNVFTNNFLKRKLKLNPNNEKFRNSYYGGRVECFRFGRIKPCYKYDVNSLYPFVCTRMFFPDFNKVKKGRNNNTKYFSSYILYNFEGCVNVSIEHKKNFVGTLPYRRDTEIIFPYGVYSAWYNFNELRAAVNTGLVRIVKVHEYYYAPKIFFSELSEYMLYFYKQKNNTEGAEKMINKFFLNALTGKFGQKRYGKKEYFKNIVEASKVIDKLNDKTKYQLHHFSEEREDCFLEIFSEQKERKINWNIPAISSYITSEARVYMLQFYLKYQKNLLYTDTDSLVLNKPLDHKFISETILGMFKKEHDTEIEIIGNKHYYSKVKGEKVVHIKGVGKNYKQRGKNYSFKRMIRTKESLRQNTHAGMFVEVVKHIAPDYTKRKVNKNNYTSTLKLNEK